MRTALILFLLAGLTGCSTGRIETTPVIGADGNPALTKYTKKPIIKTIKSSRSSVAMQETSKQIESASKKAIKETELKIEAIKSRDVECHKYTPEQVAQLSENGEVAYLNSVDSCQERSMFGNIVFALADALSVAVQDESDIQAISRHGTQAAVNIESEISSRVKSGLAQFFGFGEKGLLYNTGENILTSAFENAGDRNTTVGDISVDSSIKVGPSSNDPSTAGGELASGSATAETINNIENTPEINLIVGRDNDLIKTTTSDAARAYVASSQVQQVETNASAVQTSEAVTDDITNAEELNNDDNSVRDEE